MSKFYCGIKDKVPKGKVRGSMKECAENGNICYYGIKKIDSKLVEARRSRKNRAPTENQLVKQWGTLAGKITKLKKNIPYEKDKKRKKEMKETLKKLTAELNVIAAQRNKIKDEREKKAASHRSKSSKSKTSKGSKRAKSKGSKRSLSRHSKYSRQHLRRSRSKSHSRRSRHSRHSRPRHSRPRHSRHSRPRRSRSRHSRHVRHSRK